MSTEYIRYPSNNGGGGGGGPVTGLTGSPKEFVYIDNSGNGTGDALAIRDSVTNATKIGRSFTTTITEYTATYGSVVGSGGGSSGTPVNGDTFIDSPSGATGVIEHYGPGVGASIITISSGVVSNGDFLACSPSGASVEVGQLFDPSVFIVGNTFSILDIDTGSPVGTGTITALVAGGYKFTLSSGTVAINNVILDNPGSPSKAAGFITLSSAPIVSTSTTGFLSDTFSGIQGSVLIQDNGTDSISAGVVDVSGFGGGDLNFVISLNRLDGSNLFFTAGNTPSNLAMAAHIENVAGDQANLLLLDQGVYRLSAQFNGGDEFGFSGFSSIPTWFKGNMQYLLPYGTPSVNQVIAVQSVSGGSVTLNWANGGGGSSSTLPHYSVQLSDGSGGFQSDPNFIFNTNTLEITATMSNGIWLYPANKQYLFGELNGTGAPNFIAVENNSLTYTNTANVFTGISFSGSGLNDASKSTVSYNGIGANTWEAQIDGIQQYNAIVFTGSGLNDVLNPNPYTYNGKTNSSYTVTIDTPSANSFAGNFFTGSGLNDLQVISPGTYANSVPAYWAVRVEGTGVKFANVTMVSLPINGELMTGAISGYQFRFISYDASGSGTVYGMDVGGPAPIAGEGFNGNLSGSFSFNLAGVYSFTSDAMVWAVNATPLTYFLADTSPITIGDITHQIQIQFGSATGHTLTERWDFGIGKGLLQYQYTPVSGSFIDGETVSQFTQNYSGITFVGSLNDMVNGNPNSYTQTNATTYTVQIQKTNVRLNNTDNPVGGVFNVGDNVTGSISGVTAVLVSVQGNAIYYQVTGGAADFQVGDVMDNGAGVTANVTSLAGFDADWFTWNESFTGNTGELWIISTGFNLLLDFGVNIQFANKTGHTIGDQWTFSYAPSADVTGTISYSDGSANIWIYNISGSGFLHNQSTVSGNTSGAVATIISFLGNPGGFQDSFSWDDGIGLHSFRPIINPSPSSIGLSNNVNITFGAKYGHTLNDQWAFSYVEGGYLGYSISGISGSFIEGETVTSSSGGSATIKEINSFLVFKMYLVNQTGNFIMGDTVTGSTSFATLSVSGSSTNGDTFTEIFNGTPVSTQMPIVGLQPNTLSDQVILYFGASNGHTVNDNWTFSVASSSSIKLSSNETQFFYGDISNAFNTVGDRFFMDLSTGTTDFRINTEFNVNNVSNQPLFTVETNGGVDTVFVGDAPGNTTSFKTKVDVPNKTFQISTASQSHFQVFGGASSSSAAFDLDYELIVRDNSGSVDWLRIMPSSSVGFIGDANFSINGTFISYDDVHKRVQLNNTIGTKVNVDDYVYGGTYSLSTGQNHIALFSGGGGPTLFNVQNNDFNIGDLLTVSDLGGISAANNITVDFGGGVTVVSTSGSAQTYVINIDGKCVTFQKVRIGQWMLISQN